MPNNNVAILSLMAKFDDRSIEEAANKLGKTTEEALSNVGQDKFGQTIVNEFNKAMDTVKKKLKGVNLSSYTSNVLDSLFSDKDIQEKTKDLDKFIKNITNLSRSLSGLNPNSLNSMNTKQLDAVIAKQEKILEKEQEIANKKKELEGSASNIANQKRTVQTISKNYLVSDYGESNESLKKLLATGKDFDKNQEKSIEHLSKMLTLYSDMAKIEPAKGTTDTIRYNKDLLTIVREINKETSKIDAFTSGKASSFLSKNFKSMDTVNDYEVNRSQQDFVKNGLRNLNAQKSKLEKDLTTYITNTVQKNLQKTSNETEKVIDKAIKKANTLQAKIEEVRKNENSSNKPVIDNIIDESQVKSLDEIESRLYEIFDKDADGDATNKDLKEFITLYKQYEQLISQQSEYKFNPDFKEEYEYIVDSSSAMKKYADNIQMISAEQKKMVANNDSGSSENIKQLLEQEQQLEKVTTAEKKLSDVQEESVETFRQDLEKVREQINDISSKLLSLQDNSFSSLTEQVNNVTNAVSVLNDRLQSVYELVDKLNDKKLNWSELQFHQGNLEDIKNTRSRDDFGDMVSGLLYGGYLTRGYGYGVGGTGLYTARNIDEFSDFGKKANGTQSIFGYAIDWSKYPDAFKPETIESAIKIHEFLSNLQAFCIKLGSGFDKFDEKLGDINTQKLYSDYQSIFKNAKLDFEEFSNFINEMSNLVKTAGTVDKDHFSSISEELSTSDNISARFMKKNGYSGINVSGFKEFDNVDIGSVLYDIRDGAIVKRFETLYDLMNFANQQTEEINKIAEAKKNNQSLNSGEIKSEINEIKNEIIELNKTKEQLLNEINKIQSNFTNKTNISSGMKDAIQGSDATASVFSNDKDTINEAKYALEDYVSLYRELKKEKDSAKPTQPKITGVTENGKPLFESGSDPAFSAELQMKDLESEVLTIYGKNLAELAEQHEKSANAAKDQTNAEKELQSSFSTESKPETEGMEQVEKATEEAIQAKKDFSTANEGVQSSIDGSENPLKLEAELMEQIAKSAREAADAKKEFVEANKKVKDSANDSNSENKKKDKYAKHNKISEDDFLNSSNKYSSIVDKKLNSSNYVILGKTVNTELVNGLVKVTAKIKDVDGIWKSFSAKVDADGNIFEQRFKTITKNVDKLESELEKAKLKTNDLDNNTSSNSHSNKNFSYSFDEKGSQDYWNGRFKETVSSIGRCNDELARMNQYYKDIEKEQENLNSQFNKMYSGIDKYNNKLSELNKRNISDSSDDFIQRLQNYRNALTSYQNELDRLHDNPDLINKDAVDNLKRLKNNMDDILDSFRGLEKGSKSISRNTLIYNISDYMSKNTNMSKEFRKELEKLISELRSMGANADVKDIADQFFQVKQQIKEAGQEGKRFLDIILDKAKYGLAAQIGMYFGFNDIIRYIGDGITVVREFDTALTEMKKVSNETEQSLKNYQATTFDTADAVGTTAKQIQNSTADWMRLGESMSQAAESAKDANILLNVSEFDGIDEATESLVSMSQAYKDLDKMDIIDVLNNIGNNYSISTDGLATALKDSASALVTANNDLNEAVALTTSGNAITQDPSKVGAGLRTISLRLVGTEQAKQELSDLGEETDGMLTTVSKLRDTIMDATKAASKDGKGFDILDDNGNYKSTYEIMQGLADLYDDIVKKDKELGTNNLNLILETIAGKNRSNIAASILQNGDMLRSVYEDAQNSEGSATEELNKYLDSIDGKIAQLQNRVQEFWTKVIDSDAVKNGIDLLTTLVKGATNFVDKVGTLPTLLTAIGAALSFKNVGGNKMHFPMNILDSTYNLLWIQRFRM